MRIYKNRIFMRNFILIIILPFLITLILGAFSNVIIEQYVKSEINKNVAVILSQSKNNVELVLGEIDYLYMTFGINRDITLHLKRILNAKTYSIEDIWQLNMLKSILGSIAYSKPYIYSIYVYFNNPDKNFVATPEGIEKVDDYFDKEWFYHYQKINQDGFWIEKRKIRPYNFADNSIDVLTIYKKVKSPYSNMDEGVLVINIYLDYVENILNSSTYVAGHTIYMLDQKGNVLCSNVLNTDQEGALKAQYDREKSNYITKRLNSDKYNVSFISIIPKKYLYKVPIKLIKLMVILLIVCFILAFIIAYYVAKINYKNIKKIIDVIESATAGKTIPSVDIKNNDEYGYIMYNVVKNFIEQHYLNTRLQALELLALQSQINPHFLFNTLEIIYLKTLALTKRPNEITKMIENLSTILKYSLSNPTTTISLRDEIENTKCYIDLVKTRYKDKFDVVWQYDEDVLDKNVMKLLFQPLIENSIYHGIKPIEKRCAIKIKIKEDKVNKVLDISVIDNGVGMSKEKLEEVNQKLDEEFSYSEKIGLFNTHERLKLIYGSNFKMKIKSKLGIGTVVKITIPCYWEGCENHKDDEA